MDLEESLNKNVTRELANSLLVGEDDLKNHDLIPEKVETEVVVETERNPPVEDPRNTTVS